MRRERDRQPNWQTTRAAWVAIVTVLVCVMVFVLPLLGFRCGSSGAVDFAFRRADLEQMVRNIKAANAVQPGTETRFLTSDLITQKALLPHRYDPNAQVTDDKLVSVNRSASGDYDILFITKDFGHAGRAGYEYTDDDTAGGFGVYERQGRVAPHWWAVYDNSE